MAIDGQWFLITLRTGDPASGTSGFPEVYFCTSCKDYFGLAWCASAGLPGGSVERLLGPIASEAITPIVVHCPVCKTRYAQYGDVPRMGAAASGTEQASVLASFNTTFPLDAGEKGVFSAGGLTIERLVVLLTGPFPPPEHRAVFSQEVIHHLITSAVGPITNQGGVPVNLFATSSLSDDTQWLTRFLNAHVYAGAPATRVFATIGPFNLNPPLERILICAVTR